MPRSLIHQSYGYGETFNGPLTLYVNGAPVALPQGVNEGDQLAWVGGTRRNTFASGGVETGGHPINDRPFEVSGIVSDLSDVQVGSSMRHIGAVFQADTHCVTPIGCNASGWAKLSSAGTYVSPAGGRRARPQPVEVVIPIECVWSHLGCMLTNNSLQQDGYIDSMVNGVTGFQSAAVTAGQEFAWFQDQTNADDLSPGDRISVYAGSTGAGFGELERITSILTSPTQTALIVGGYARSSPANRIAYFPLGGRLYGFGPDPTLAEHALGYETLVSALFLLVSEVQGSCTVTATLQVDGVDKLAIETDRPGVVSTSGSVVIPKGAKVRTKVEWLGTGDADVQSISYAAQENGGPPPPPPPPSSRDELASFIRKSSDLAEAPTHAGADTYTLSDGTAVYL